MTCTFEGCTKPRRSKDLCDAHYRQLLRGETLRPLRKSPGPAAEGRSRAKAKARARVNEGPCTGPECDKPARTAGLCTGHYQQSLRRPGEPLRPLVKRVRGTCAVEDCDRPHYAHGWCEMHGARVKATGTTDPRPRPARKPKPSNELPPDWFKPSIVEPAAGRREHWDVGWTPPMDPALAARMRDLCTGQPDAETLIDMLGVAA